MGSLLGSFKNMFREKREKAAKALADPVRDGKFAIEDAKKEVRAYTTDVAGLRAETIKTEAEYKEALAKKKQYEGRAKKAGEAGNKEHVTTFVGKITEWTTRASELKKQIDMNKKTQAGLQSQLDRARTKINRAEQNHQTLKARSKGVALRKSLVSASDKFKEGQGGLAALDDLEESVRDGEAEVQAMEEMATDVDEDLDAQYDADSTADTDMVAKFMAGAAK